MRKGWVWLILHAGACPALCKVVTLKFFHSDLLCSRSAASPHLELGEQAQQVVHDQVVYLGCRFHACWPATHLQVEL